MTTGIVITYVLDGPTHGRTTTRKPATTKTSNYDKPYAIPVPIDASMININGETIENDEIYDRVRHSINESPRNIIDSNRQLYNEIPVPYSQSSYNFPKSSFKFPKIRFGRDVN